MSLALTRSESGCARGEAAPVTIWSSQGSSRPSAATWLRKSATVLRDGMRVSLNMFVVAIQRRTEGNDGHEGVLSKNGGHRPPLQHGATRSSPGGEPSFPSLASVAIA